MKHVSTISFKPQQNLHAALERHTNISTITRIYLAIMYKVTQVYIYWTGVGLHPVPSGNIFPDPYTRTRHYKSNNQTIRVWQFAPTCIAVANDSYESYGSWYGVVKHPGNKKTAWTYVWVYLQLFFPQQLPLTKCNQIRSSRPADYLHAIRPLPKHGARTPL